LSAEASPLIAVYLANCYEFWDVNVYPCEADGRLSREALDVSPPRFFTAEQADMIDTMAGLPWLGAELKNFADFLMRFAGDIVCKA